MNPLNPDPPLVPPLPGAAPPVGAQAKIAALKILFKNGSEHIGRFTNLQMSTHHGKLVTFEFEAASPELPYIDLNEVAAIIVI